MSIKITSNFWSFLLYTLLFEVSCHDDDNDLFVIFSASWRTSAVVLISDCDWVFSGHIGTILEEKFCGRFYFNLVVQQMSKCSVLFDSPLHIPPTPPQKNWKAAPVNCVIFEHSTKHWESVWHLLYASLSFKLLIW